MADPVVTALSLFSGVGGLDLGLRLAIPGLRVLGYVEREAYAAAVLLARMEDSALEPTPIWCGDIADLDASLFAGVDLVCGGFPCTPSSTAGQRRGTADERWLWPEIVRVVRAVDPRLVFVENVGGLLTVNGGGAFGEVVEDLAALGFDVEWGCLSAAAVGAPHLRERLFLLAHRDGAGLALQRGDGLLDGERPASGDDADRRGGATLADPGCAGDQRRREPGDLPRSPGAGEGEGPERERHGDAARDGREALADSRSSGRGQGAGPVPARESELGPGIHALADPARVGERESNHAPPAVGRGGARQDAGGRGVHVADTDGDGRHQAIGGEAGERRPDAPGGALGHSSGERLEGRLDGLGARERLPFPPGPATRAEWAAILAERPDLAPAVEPGLRVLAPGLAGGVERRWPVSRADELRVLGNGVVCLAGGLAFVLLAERAGLMGASEPAGLVVGSVR